MSCYTCRLHWFVANQHKLGTCNAIRTKHSPSRTASTIPAVSDEQLSWSISRGTDMKRVMGGSLSMIMSAAYMISAMCKQRAVVDTHSSSFSTLFSIASAGFPNTARQTCVCIDINAGRKRISRFGAFDDASPRQAMSSSTRVPIR